MTVRITAPRKGQPSPRARWTDPNTGRRETKTFNASEYSAADIDAWVEKKNLELEASKRANIAATNGELISAHVEPYLASKVLRTSTEAIYRSSLLRFCAWGASNGCVKTGQITREKLISFRTFLLVQQRLEPSTANKVKRNVVSLLLHLYEQSLLSSCSREDIRFGMRRAKEKKTSKPLVDPQALIESFKCQSFEIQAFVYVLLLTGMRFGELFNLKKRNCVNLDRMRIELDASDTKTNSARVVWLEESPSVVAVLGEVMKSSSGAGDNDKIWPLTKHQLDSAKSKVVRSGFPRFTWQALRRTCGSYLTCAPGIYGAASAFNSSKRLGHSVLIAERLYVGAVRGIPFEAKTLELAMGIAIKPEVI